MTPEQQKDLETIEYFIPDNMRHVAVTDEDRRMFLEHSERGLHKDKIGEYVMDGFNVLIQGKRWRGIHMQMWEEGHLDGSFPYITLVEECPRSVVEFAARELFQGIDKDAILGLLNRS